MLNIIVKLGKGKTKSFKIDPSITVGDFKKIIAQEEGAEDVKLVYKAKPLNKNHVKLIDIGVTESCTMFAALKVIGGTIYVEPEGGCHSFKDNEVRKYTSNIATIVTSDCILGLSDGCYNTSIKKIKLDCGCIFCPDCMRCVIKKMGAHHHRIQCGTSLSNHENEIPLDLALAVAAYNDKEANEMQASLTEQWMNCKTAIIKLCPNTSCQSWIYRGDNLGNVNRVRCPSCKAFDFCWFCREKWVGDGAKNCANAACDLRASYLALLNASEKKRIDFVTPAIDNVPDTRICINMDCCAINIHFGHCKHMTCKHCKAEYCQSCLCKWKNGCDLSKKCTPAGTQEITQDMFNIMQKN